MTTRSDVTFTVTFTVAEMPATGSQLADVTAWIESVLEAASDDVALTDADVRYRIAGGISSITHAEPVECDHGGETCVRIATGYLNDAARGTQEVLCVDCGADVTR